MATLSFKAHLSLMANYNAVMNAKLIRAMEPLADEALLEQRGAFFGSILGTFNHLIVADILWLGRMRSQPFGNVLSSLDAFPHPRALSDMLYSSLAEFAAPRAAVDELFIRFIAELTEDNIAAPLAYRNSQDLPFVKTLGLVLSHVFNHQTHHRGQITTLLNQMKLDIGVTDLAPLVPNLA